MRFTCSSGVNVPLYSCSYKHTCKFQDHAHIGRIVNPLFLFYLFFFFFFFFFFGGGGMLLCVSKYDDTLH